MIHPTFASLKQHRDPQGLKIFTQLKYEPVPATFREARENGKPNITSKRLENQQNTLANHCYPIQPLPSSQNFTNNLVRKPLVKVERSGKRNHQVYRSPSHRTMEMLQQSNYELRPNQSMVEQTINLMTPNLTKTNRSFVNDQLFNSSFLTQKQRAIVSSQQGQVSVSSKNSFNDSFQLYQDLSYQEDNTPQEGNDFVNSSLQLQRNGPELNRTINQFPSCENQLKTMKKSTHFYYNNDLHTTQKVLKDLDERSVTSSVSSNMGSLKFSQKFKHYKRRESILVPPKHQRCFKLSDFKLLQQIGCGKYGLVFLAKHQQTGFICALKKVQKKVIREQHLQVPFMREVKIQLYLNHPNIVKLYGLFHDQKNVYLIMEYCSGNHLFKQIRERRQFQEDQIIKILGNLFEAVAYIHSNGIIHRDLKPENIVIQHGVYKLCDFGWAAYACGDSRTTFCGTPLYVCPEVLKGQEYNEKADVWALGIITYQLAFGRVPFAIINPNDLIKIINDPVYFPLWGQTAEKLIPFVRRMLSKRSEQRPCLNQILASDIFRGFHQCGMSEVGHELDRCF